MPTRPSKVARNPVHREPAVGELAILQRIRAQAFGGRSSFLKLGIGDDCALLKPGAGEEVAVTTDLTVAGTHYRLDWHTPESAGHRTLARGLSDLAAMGATPMAAFLSLGLPRPLARPKGRWTSSWVARFLDGLLSLAAEHRTPLAGGDLSETPVPLADIVLLGSVPGGKALLRSGARPGDVLYVTGSLGGGAASLPHFDRLAKLKKTRNFGLKPSQIPKELRPLMDRHLFPQPRIAQGLWLRRHGTATAAMDLSDGLSTDLLHLCEESHVAAEVDASRLPIHPRANLEFALHGGDDYELLFTSAPETRLPAQIAGVPITRIGRILAAPKDRPNVAVITPSGREPLTPQGWQHFV